MQWGEPGTFASVSKLNRLDRVTTQRSATTVQSVQPRPSAAEGLSKHWLARLTLLVVLLGVTYQRVRLGGGMMPVDLLLAAVCLWAVVDMTTSATPATALLRRLALPWWLVLIASLVALIDDGLPGWGVLDILRTSFALLFFLSILHLVWRFNLQRWSLYATGAAMLFAIASLLMVTGSARSEGLFTHPNYAAHFLFVAGFFLACYAPHPLVRVSSMALAAYGIVLTASFGALLMVGVAVLGFLVIRRPRYWPLLLCLALLVGAFGVRATLDDTNQADRGPISAQRFERSQEGRESIWSNSFQAWLDDPLGIGPGGTAAKDINGTGHESHSDWLGYLFERGPLGLAGLVLLYFRLYTFVPPRSYARVLILCLAVGGAFRETLNYRHTWIILACVIAYELGPKGGGMVPVGEDEVAVPVDR
jgi:hypothetical protein